MISRIYNLKNKTKKCTQPKGNRLTDRENKLVDTGVVDQEAETAMSEIDERQVCLGQHGALYPLICNNIKWSITYISTESVC